MMKTQIFLLARPLKEVHCCSAVAACEWAGADKKVVDNNYYWVVKCRILTVYFTLKCYDTDVDCVNDVVLKQHAKQTKPQPQPRYQNMQG